MVDLKNKFVFLKKPHWKIAGVLLLILLAVQISIKALDQRIIMKNEPKSYNFVIERAAEVNLSKPAADWKANER